LSFQKKKFCWHLTNQKLMATRAECDSFYQQIGLPRFSESYDPEMILSRASELPESKAAHIRRCVALAKTVDVDEYFCLSEYATEPEAVRALVDPKESGSPTFLLKQSDNSQYPLSFHVIPSESYCFEKYARNPNYVLTPMDVVGLDDKLCFALLNRVSNLPSDMIQVIIRESQGVLLHLESFERGEDEDFVDVEADEPLAPFFRYINCLLGMVVFSGA
jgi:hypothetical protein